MRIQRGCHRRGRPRPHTPVALIKQLFPHPVSAIFMIISLHSVSVRICLPPSQDKKKYRKKCLCPLHVSLGYPGKLLVGSAFPSRREARSPCVPCSLKSDLIYVRAIRGCFAGVQCCLGASEGRSWELSCAARSPGHGVFSCSFTFSTLNYPQMMGNLKEEIYLQILALLTL